MGATLIAATGTDCGKTLLTAGLLWQARQAGHTLHAVKPVISGFDAATPERSDTGQHLTAMGQAVTPDAVAACSPWRYARPVSPHLAGAEDDSLTAEAICRFCKDVAMQEGDVLIEGAGGLMTPLVQGFTQLDLAEALHLPVVLVTGCHLGTISHTLTAVEAMRARHVAIRAIVVCDAPHGTEPLEEVCTSIRSHVPAALRVFTVPRISPKTEAVWQYLPPLLEIISHDHT